MSHKKLYTTSEYVNALVLQANGNLYSCNGKEFCLFSSAAAAEYDAQWLVDFYKREGKRVRKPVVYRVRLEKVDGSGG